MSVDEMSVDEMFVDKLNVDERSKKYPLQGVRIQNLMASKLNQAPKSKSKSKFANKT